jgi:hypothetical protein
MIIKRNIFVLVLLITIPCMASASPRPRDSLLVVNHTDGDIFIEVEYLWKPMEMGVVWPFGGKIGNLEVDIYIYRYAPLSTAWPWTSTTILHSNRQMIFLEMMPKWSRQIDGRSPYDILREISMLERIRLAVKALKITNGEGDVLFSLEGAGEEDLVVESDGGEKSGVRENIDYFLVIQGR